MSRIVPMGFQQRHIGVLVSRFLELKNSYSTLGRSPDPSQLAALRKNGACALLQAPTGIGKTLMACEVMSALSSQERMIWFWFAPFTGVLSQAKSSLKRQAPALTQLDIESDRQAAKLSPGAVYVLSWQTVAARSRESRLARQNGDAGLSVDELVEAARELGYRIGVVVDEAHHGFVRAQESSRFFANVLAPDYVLLMTATPRDADISKFSEQTGYRVGSPAEWASISRAEGVKAELLKKSVKAARFIVQNQDDAALLAFEEVAMAECAAMHRLIKKTLNEAKIGLTPLMLVQVPNGGQALASAKEFLIKSLRFREDTVRVHTADEPDPNLSALADDPSVEVILFKMAIATGFDAPRAFTLAALRGTRDSDFGIQVVGRIMRVHRLLQGRVESLPPLLQFGYVYLANSESQEGLIAAASQINRMPGQLAAAQPSTVVTVIAGQNDVQFVQLGRTLSLLPGSLSDSEARVPPLSVSATDPSGETGTPLSVLGPQPSLFSGLSLPAADGSSRFAWGYGETSELAKAFALDAEAPGHRYPLKADAPRELHTEQMPAVPSDFEERLVSHIDFSRVLGDRLKVRSRVTERVTDVFEAVAPVDHDVWASVSPRAIAVRARQIAFEFDDVDSRELLRALKERFTQALLNEGHVPPDDDEELTRQLELVLVRNDRMIRDAHKRLRASQVLPATVRLPASLESVTPLSPAARNIYGVFPDDLSPTEREFSEILDTAGGVRWWHRNPSRRPESVALYRWADGVGFFPDFVVAVAERSEGGGIALSEVKGPHLQHYERQKAAAQHITYGRVFMAGKAGSDGGFRLWRLAGDQLIDDGPFEVARMRFS